MSIYKVVLKPTTQQLEYSGITAGNHLIYLEPTTGGTTTTTTTLSGLTTTTTTLTLQISTTSATSITYMGATLGGNITNDGGSTITARGVQWSSTNDFSGTVYTYSTTGTTGSWTEPISNDFNCTGAIYYYRAYATNGIGTYYGETKNFTTSTPTFIVVNRYTGTTCADAYPTPTFGLPNFVNWPPNVGDRQYTNGAGPDECFSASVGNIYSVDDVDFYLLGKNGSEITSVTLCT